MRPHFVKILFTNKPPSSSPNTNEPSVSDGTLTDFPNFIKYVYIYNSLLISCHYKHTAYIFIVINIFVHYKYSLIFYYYINKTFLLQNYVLGSLQSDMAYWRKERDRWKAIWLFRGCWPPPHGTSSPVSWVVNSSVSILSQNPLRTQAVCNVWGLMEELGSGPTHGQLRAGSPTQVLCDEYTK